MSRAIRIAITAVLVLSFIAVPPQHASAESVEQRIAEFWRRVDALAPSDLLIAADLGQWALNVIERDASARITVADFRVATGGMQASMDRAGRAPAPTTSAPSWGGIPVEQRIADFWKRIDATQPGDYLSSGDLGQWALNVIERDASARITVAHFRVATGGMQVSMDRARRAPGFVASPTPPRSAPPTNPPRSAPPTNPPRSAPPTNPPSSLSVTITTSAWGAISASTTPGATCSVRVRFPSGNYSSAAGVGGSVTAGSSGNVSWTYRTTSNTLRGTGTNTVTCSLRGQTGSALASFSVP